MDDKNEGRLTARTGRARVCFFGDMLRGSHLHTVRCNKETRTDYAGLSVRIAAPAIAACVDEMTWYIYWWLVISHKRADKGPHTKERLGFLGCALSGVALSLNSVAPI